MLPCTRNCMRHALQLASSLYFFLTGFTTCKLLANHETSRMLQNQSASPKLHDDTNKTELEQRLHNFLQPAAAFRRCTRSDSISGTPEIQAVRLRPDLVAQGRGAPFNLPSFSALCWLIWSHLAGAGADDTNTRWHARPERDGGCRTVDESIQREVNRFVQTPEGPRVGRSVDWPRFTWRRAIAVAGEDGWRRQRQRQRDPPRPTFFSPVGERGVIIGYSAGWYSHVVGKGRRGPDHLSTLTHTVLYVRLSCVGSVRAAGDQLAEVIRLSACAEKEPIFTALNKICL